MGRDSLKCKHKNKKEIWEDHILMGDIFYGHECKDCGKFIEPGPSPIELGVYR